LRVLLTADLHTNRFWYEWLISQASEFDLISIAGDLLEGFSAGIYPGQKQDIECWLGRFVQSGCAVAICSGNHEMHLKTSLRVVVDDGISVKKILRSLLPNPPLADCHPLFLKDGATGIIESVHGKLVVSTIPYQKFGDPESLSAKSPLWEEGRSLKNQTGCPWLVLHHDPPGGGPVGGMAGDFVLRHTIEEFQPDFLISGHLHGQPFFEGGGFHERIGASHCFNAGQTPPEKSRIPNYISLDTSRRLATWFYFDISAGLFREEKRCVI
jgi:predicted phosphodiesterase